MHSCRLGLALGWGPAGGLGTGLGASAAGPYASAVQLLGTGCAKIVPAQQNKGSVVGLALQLKFGCGVSEAMTPGDHPVCWQEYSSWGQFVTSVSPHALAPIQVCSHQRRLAESGSSQHVSFCKMGSRPIIALLR